MKIIAKGKVYDLDWGKCEDICLLDQGKEDSPVGTPVFYSDRLKVCNRDENVPGSGDFFILRQIDGNSYAREGNHVVPISKENAIELAENRIAYEQYVKVFGHPGETVEEKETNEIDDLKAKLASMEKSRDNYSKWLSEERERTKVLAAKLEKIEEELKKLQQV